MAALPGLPDVDVTLRRTARARRFSLRVGSADGRVTLTITDASGTPLVWKTVAALGIQPATPPRSGTHGAEITGTGFTVSALAEVQDPTTLMWHPYLDYYDAAPTPETGGMTAVSFGGSFYSE